MHIYIKVETKCTPFADDIFKSTFINQSVCFPNKVSPKYVLRGQFYESPVFRFSNCSAPTRRLAII